MCKLTDVAGVHERYWLVDSLSSTRAMCVATARQRLRNRQELQYRWRCVIASLPWSPTFQSEGILSVVEGENRAAIVAAAGIIAWSTYAVAEYGYSTLKGPRQHYGAMASAIELVSDSFARSAHPLTSYHCSTTINSRFSSIS